MKDQQMQAANKGIRVYVQAGYKNLDSLRFAVNCSLLFTELPLLRRPAAAKAAGFETIEFWWPFASAVPADKEVDEFVSAVNGAGVWLAGLNFYAGDLAGQDCGAVSVPALSQAFRDNVDVATGIGGQLGVSVFNALYGNRVKGVPESHQDELAVENLMIAAEAAARIGAALLIEAVSGPKPYPIRTADQAVAVVDRVNGAGAKNVSFLMDIYHLAANADDIAAAIERHSARIGHVQIADHPGRGQPGSGELEISRYLEQLQAAGYSGLVSLEYRPTGATLESLEWLPRQARGRSTVRGSGDSG
jgi:hydroxypyruvate isomerase